MFNIIYNRGSEVEVSGGCIGLLLFFIEVECVDEM